MYLFNFAEKNENQKKDQKKKEPKKSISKR